MCDRGRAFEAREGMRVGMALSPGQNRPGGLGTPDHIPDASFVRNDLTVWPDWKPQISHVQVGEPVGIGPESELIWTIRV